MAAINKITSVEIYFHKEEAAFELGINGIRFAPGEKVDMEIPEDNAKAVARALTRLAMEYWHIFDQQALRKELIKEETDGI